MSAMQKVCISRHPESEFPRVRAFNESYADGTRDVGVVLWRTVVSVSWRRKSKPSPDSGETSRGVAS